MTSDVERILGADDRPLDSLAGLGAIAVSNLVPLVGVLVWGWSLGAVMLLFWLENAVLGLLNYPKVVLARRGEGRSEGVRGVVVTLAFFSLHYWLVWAGHGVFLVDLFVPSWAVVVATLPTMVLGVVAMFVQHSVAAYRQFYREGRHRVLTPDEQKHSPYGRVITLHLGLVGGGFAVRSLGTPVFGLVSLVLFKTGYDVVAWWRERE